MCLRPIISLFRALVFLLGGSIYAFRRGAHTYLVHLLQQCVLSAQPRFRRVHTAVGGRHWALLLVFFFFFFFFFAEICRKKPHAMVVISARACFLVKVVQFLEHWKGRLHGSGLHGFMRKVVALSSRQTTEYAVFFPCFPPLPPAFRPGRLVRYARSLEHGGHGQPRRHLAAQRGDGGPYPGPLGAARWSHRQR